MVRASRSDRSRSFASGMSEEARMLSRRLLLFFWVSLLCVSVSAQDLDKLFWEAARRGDAESVKALLAKDVDVNTPFLYGATALFYACDRGHVEVVKVLLEHGAEVNLKDTFLGATPLRRALRRGHTEVVKLLLDKGAEGINRVLLSGATGGKIELVKIALDKGSLRAESLTAALASATESGYTEMAELLRQAGAAAPVKLPLETLKKYAGTYRISTGEEYVFSVDEGKLYIGGDGWGPYELLALDETTMILKQFAAGSIIFQLEGEKVSGLVRKRGEREDFYKKVEEERL